MINKVILIGHIGDEPEVRSFEGGSKMARVRIATSERVFVRKSNEWRQHTEWHTVIFWGEAATFVDQYIHKGTQVYTEGALRSREVTTPEGVKHRVMEIAGREIKIIAQSKAEAPQNTQKPQEQTSTFTSPRADVDDLPF